MRALIVFIGCLALRAETPRAHVYIVTRAANVEARAVLSGRLVGLNATSLQWIENSGVVRAELPQDAVDRVKSDKDVVLVLNSEEPAPAEPSGVTVVPPAAGSTRFAMPVPGAAMPVMPAPGMEMAGMGLPGLGLGGMGMPGMGMGGMGMGGMGMGGMGMGGMGMPMGGVTNMIDMMLGSLARKLIIRTPSCKVAVKNTQVNFGGAGGDGVIPVVASGSCLWQAQSSVDWIKINSGSGVSGAGVISYTVKPGAPAGRSGSISIVAAGGGTAIKGRASLVIRQAENCCAAGF